MFPFSGFFGHLLKSAGLDDIVAAIREARDGGAPMSMQIARMVVRSFNNQPTLPAFSDRQHKVLRLMCEGKSYQAIAQEMFISKSIAKPR